jgi:rhodanese-related sulfurtransferase
MERLPEFVANHLFLFSLLVSILALLMWNLFGDMLSGVKSILPEEVTRLINREDAKVVDLRPQKEFESGHIIDAINISADQLASQLEKLKKHKENGIIFCCATGSVSTKEAQKLMNEGYEKVYSLKGGIMSWRNANLPLTKGLK